MLKYILTCYILITSTIFAQDNFVVTEKQQVQAQSTPEENNTPYFVMFTSFGCAPCNRMKASEIPKVEAKGYSVVIIDVSKNDTWTRSWGITNVPRTFLIDRKTRKRIYGPWIGFTRSEDLIKVAKDKSSDKKVVQKLNLKDWINSNYTRNTQLSWDVSGQSVYDHLCDGSNGTHVFKKSEVSNLELWEAFALHDAIHTGKFKP